MDITFSQESCVEINTNDDTIIKTILLNNGQDGSFKEYSSIKMSRVINIHYNYPDQELDDPSSITFTFKRVADQYFIVIIISDFSVILDVPINLKKI